MSNIQMKNNPDFRFCWEPSSNNQYKVSAMFYPQGYMSCHCRKVARSIIETTFMAIYASLLFFCIAQLISLPVFMILFALIATNNVVLWILSAHKHEPNPTPAQAEIDFLVDIDTEQHMNSTVQSLNNGQNSTIPMLAQETKRYLEQGGSLHNNSLQYLELRKALEDEFTTTKRELFTHEKHNAELFVNVLKELTDLGDSNRKLQHNI